METPNSNGADATSITRYTIASLQIGDAQGMVVDASEGQLYILDSISQRVVRLTPGQNGNIDGSLALQEGRVDQIDLQHIGIKQLRGIALNPINQHLYLLGLEDHHLYELTQTGQLVKEHDLSELNLTDPQGITFAPSRDMTDDPAQFHLFIADSGLLRTDETPIEIDPSLMQNQIYLPLIAQHIDSSVTGAAVSIDKIAHSGQLVEIDLEQPIRNVHSASTVTLPLVRTIDSSKFDPPSPDSAGITYNSWNNRLVMSDSEVNEISQLFTGDNVFELTLSGSLRRTFTTVDFSNEPTGAAFNSNNGHMFYSDDNRDEIYEVNPGPDKVSGTNDDTVTSFDTRGYGSGDPEGLSYDPINNVLYIADGVNREVYIVQPGPNGTFDGISSGSDDTLDQFDTRGLGIDDPEGIYYNPTTGNLTLTGAESYELFEVTTSGELLQVFNVAAANARLLSGLTMAPNSTDSSRMSYYIADRGVDNAKDPDENDGKIYELDAGSGSDTPPTRTPTSTPTSTSTSTAVGPIDTPTPTSTPSTTPTRPSGIQKVAIRVAERNDDAEERNSGGRVVLSSSDLELIMDGSREQTVGIRFQNVLVPKGATIVNAFIELTTDEATNSPTSLLIRGEDSDNATQYSETDYDVSSRNTTGASVSWPNIPAWNTVGEKHHTPNLASIVQEIVNRGGWGSGHAMAFVITGSGHRVAEAYRSNPDIAPLLCIEFVTDGTQPSTATPTATATSTTVPVGDTPTPTATATFISSANTPTPTTTPTATSSSGSGEIIELNPTDDTRVRDDRPTSDYDTSATLRLSAGSRTQYSYLKFNVTGLNRPVQSAKLRLYVTNSSDDGGSVYLVSNNYVGSSTPWIESELIWNNAPPLAGSPLGHIGPVRRYTWIEVDVASAINGNGTYSFGLSNTSSDEAKYSTMNSSSNHPLLVIEQ